MFFPIIQKIFMSPHSRSHAVNELKRFILQNEHLTLKSASEHEFIIEARNASYLMLNSFLPTIEINITEEHPTNIFCSASLKSSTKLVLALLSVLAGIFEVLLIVLWLFNGYPASLILLLPVAILLSAFVLTNIAIRFSTQNIVKQLFEFLC